MHSKHRNATQCNESEKDFGLNNEQNANNDNNCCTNENKHAKVLHEKLVQSFWFFDATNVRINEMVTIELLHSCNQCFLSICKRYPPLRSK